MAIIDGSSLIFSPKPSSAPEIIQWSDFIEDPEREDPLANIFVSCFQAFWRFFFLISGQLSWCFCRHQVCEDRAKDLVCPWGPYRQTRQQRGPTCKYICVWSMFSGLLILCFFLIPGQLSWCFCRHQVCEDRAKDLLVRPWDPYPQTCQERGPTCKYICVWSTFSCFLILCFFSLIPGQLSWCFCHHQVCEDRAKDLLVRPWGPYRQTRHPWIPYGVSCYTYVIYI